MPHKDPEVRKQYQSDYHKRQHIVERARNYRESHRLYYRINSHKRRDKYWNLVYECLIELHIPLQCKDCGESHISCLQFHHRDENAKVFEIGHVYKRSKDDLLLELSKCDILCANCHSKLHYELDQQKRKADEQEYSSALT